MIPPQFRATRYRPGRWASLNCRTTLPLPSTRERFPGTMAFPPSNAATPRGMPAQLRSYCRAMVARRPGRSSTRLALRPRMRRAAAVPSSIVIWAVGPFSMSGSAPGVGAGTGGFDWAGNVAGERKIAPNAARHVERSSVFRVMIRILYFTIWRSFLFWESFGADGKLRGCVKGTEKGRESRLRIGNLFSRGAGFRERRESGLDRQIGNR